MKTKQKKTFNFYKKVTQYSCIHCKRKFELTDQTFHCVNNHGIGSCSDCYKLKLRTATVHTMPTYIPPAVLRFIHDAKIWEQNPTFNK